jgi:PAS domain S-box-containing protein
VLEPDIPPNEVSRLAALHGLKILDTPPEERFDRLTRLARQLVGVPIAVVSLVDTNRQWFKSCQGLDATETPRSISFCGHAILEDQMLVISDALLDARFVDNPLVCGAPHIRFYAGQPLKAADGSRLGTLCVIDSRPHLLTQAERDGLRDLALLVENELNSLEINESVCALQESAARLNLALAASNSSMWDANLTTGRIALDVHWSEMLGEEPHETELSFEQLAQLAPPEEAPYIKKQLAATFKGEKKDYRVEHQVRHRLGHWIWIESRGSVIARDAAGRALRMIGTNTDITERNHAVRAQHENEARLAAILDNVLDGIITINEQGIVESFNKSAEKIFGYAAAEVIGRNIKMLMPEPYHSEHDGYLHNFTSTGRKKIIGIGRQVVGRRRDGSTFPMDLAVSEMHLGDKRMFSGIVRDITERVRIERMKSEFISTVSHELRTPLTSIRGSLGLIVGGVAGTLPAQANSLIDIAHKNCERLILLVNDILDMEKIEAGKMEFQSAPIELLPLLKQALEGNRSYGEQFGVSFELSGESPELKVHVDANRLQQVLANLLSNAAKFSPQGDTVLIVVTADRERVRVAVSDHGSGIPAAFQSQIFQKFAQADASDTRKKGGTGLGLSITRAIVEQMGGRIGFTSEPNVLTTFWVEFPICLGTTPHIADEKREDIKPRVLICEDDQDVASLLSMMLEQSGLDTDIASNAMQAKQLLALHVYAAMTLDLGLPDQSGISLIRELRSNKQTANLPIIVVSANADKGRKELNAEAFSVVDWIVKVRREVV